MPMLLLVAVPLAAGALAALIARRWPRLDPASPAGPAERLREEVTEEVAASPPARRLTRRVGPVTISGFGVAAAWIVLVVGGLVLGLLILLLRRHAGLDDMDLATAYWAADHAQPFATGLMSRTTDLGLSRVVVPVAVLLAIVEGRRRRSWTVPLFLLAVVGGQMVLYNVLKLIFDRARPAIDPLAAFAGPSFPSGHSTGAAACWAAFALVVGLHLPQRWWPLLAGSAVAVGTYVGTTRVLLGVHWLSDVIAGLALGWGWFAACSLMFGGRLMRAGYPVADAGLVGSAP